MKCYWAGKISQVTDRDGERPEIEMVLSDWIVETPGEVPLPRSGESYWLVDDATFRRLILKDDDA